MNVSSYLQYLGFAGLSTGTAVYGIYALNSGDSLLNFNLIYPTGSAYLLGTPYSDFLPLIYNGPGTNPNGVLSGQGFYQISDEFSSDFSVILSLGYSGCNYTGNLNQILSSTSQISGAQLFITPSNRLSIQTPDYQFTIPREIGVNDFAYFSVLGGRYLSFGLFSIQDNQLYLSNFDEGNPIINVSDLYFGGALQYNSNFTGYSGNINNIFLFSGNLSQQSVVNCVNASFVTGITYTAIPSSYTTFVVTGSVWQAVQNIQVTGITQVLSSYPKVTGGSGYVFIDSGITGNVTTNQALIPLLQSGVGIDYYSGISFLFNTTQMMSGILSDFYFPGQLCSGDTVEIYTYQIFNPNFNGSIQNFQYPSSPNIVQIYANGLAETQNLDYSVAFNNLIIGYDTSDILQYDIYQSTVTGPYTTGFLQTGTTGANFVNITGASGITMAGFNYDVYLNGQKMVSGVNFSVAGTQLTVSGNDLMDINDPSGDYLEIKFIPIYPNIIKNTYQITQSQNYLSGVSGFTEQIWLNGLRQMNGLDYLKLPRCRFCSGSFNTPNYTFPLYTTLTNLNNAMLFNQSVVLSASSLIGGGTTLSWTYEGQTPITWQFYTSNDNLIWNLSQILVGTTNSWETLILEKYWEIQGTDDDGNPTTPMSNIVYH